MKHLTFFMLLLMPLNLAAQDASNTKSEDAVQEQKVQEEKVEEATPIQDQPVAANATPRAEALRERKLSDAFKQFIPSERISADNAVPVPIDI